VAVTADGARAVSGDDGTVRGCGTWLPGKRSPAGPGTTPLSPVPSIRQPFKIAVGQRHGPTYLSSVARSTQPDQSQSPCPHRPVLLLVGPYSRHTSPAPRLTGARTRLRQGPLPARALRVV